MKYSGQGNFPPDLRSSDLPIKLLLGKGLVSIGYETEWKGVRYAKKDFVAVPSHIFREEAGLLLDLPEHDNVVTTHGLTVDKLSCSLVLGYMDDKLTDLIQKRKDLRERSPAGEYEPTLQELLDLILRIARAMEHLHKHGIIHGDLKSRNILVTYMNDGDKRLLVKSVKVADFGLVQTKRNSMPHVSHQARKLDMVRWKAPEHLKELYREAISLDPSSDSDEDFTGPACVTHSDDAYCFGLTCFQILTGEEPHSKRNWKELVKDIVSNKRRICFPENLPQGLRELLDICCDADPNQRPTFSYIRKKLEHIHSLLPGIVKEERIQQLEKVLGGRSGEEDSELPDSVDSEASQHQHPKHEVTRNSSPTTKSQTQGSIQDAVAAVANRSTTPWPQKTLDGSQRPSQLSVHNAEQIQYPGSSSTSSRHYDNISRDTDVDQIEPPTPRAYHNIDNDILDRNEARLRELRARSYLHDAEESAEAVLKMSSLLKFNKEQCEYLVGKLGVAVQSASSFLEVSWRTVAGTGSKENDVDFVKIFEFLMVLGKQIESFVGGCCKENWIQAAMVLSNMSEYVSSLGFKLDMCEVALGKEHVASRCHTLDEVDGMNKSEAGLVKHKASLDAEVLKEKVVQALNSLGGEDRDLASHLLQRLLEIKGIPIFGSGTFLSNLFAWVKSRKQVGRGASATIFKARWLGIRVAMKTFDGPKNIDFVKEVEILSRLCHPNITSIFCFTKDMRSCSIVMELMDGDLNQLINQLMRGSDSPPFPILEAVDMMLQIGEGVNYLHNQGIVHRDLKSKNILYKAVQVKDVGIQCAHVKVADFGLSKARDMNTTYSDLTCNTGTNRWMPPEVIKFSDGNQGGLLSNVVRLPRYPFKLDSYSFGLVCYEILVGKLPFWECENSNEVKRKVLNQERPILPCKPSECPLILKDLIERCWSHEPETRPKFDVICRELKYIKYLLMTGGSMKQGVDASQTLEHIPNDKAIMSGSGHLDSKVHSQPELICLPSGLALVAPHDGGKVTEVCSSSHQMSVCDDTLVDYLTLPGKSSINKSPSSKDCLKSSSKSGGSL